jgi:hypothetical protein
MKPLGAFATALLVAIVLAGTTPGGTQVTSAGGQVVPVGTRYRGACLLQGGQINGRLAYWELAGVIPAFRPAQPPNARPGLVLAPPAEQLPRLADTPKTPFGSTYVLVPRMLASPLDDDCAIRTFDPLGATTLEQAGSHVFVQYDQTVTFVRVPSDVEHTPRACATNDPAFPDPSSDIPAPPDVDDDMVWAVGTFCNTIKKVGLYVTSRARCVARGDMSRWPAFPYINQRDAGNRLTYPAGADRASGPAALLMAMRRSAPRDLPTLATVFDRTMVANTIFSPERAVPYLRSLGWRSARVLRVGVRVQQMELRIRSAAAYGPVVISTAFGTGAWGRTGDVSPHGGVPVNRGEHLITITGADRRGNFIVDDPAGNWFGSHKAGFSFQGGHYGSGSCGHQVVYPHYWLLAYATGGYLIQLGPRTS